jgi:hypothetical protein
MWANEAFPYATSSENIKRWRLPDGAVSPGLTMAYQAFTAAFPPSQRVEYRSPAIVQAKNESRRTFEKLFRSYLLAWVINNPYVSDEDRRRLGLSVRRATSTPVRRPPTEMPDLRIDYSKQQQHSLFPLNATGKKTKPPHVFGYEVYHRLGGVPPKEDEDFRYAGFSTRSPFLFRFHAEDRGKFAWYRVRWVNARNDPGPWSIIFSAVVL